MRFKDASSSSMFNYSETPHRRFNPLTGEWILVSPHRTSRPWQGKIEGTEEEERPKYDPVCYLCPGNTRIHTDKPNPDYESTFVFTNDFAAILPETPTKKQDQNPLFTSHTIQGTCRVICFSPRHDLSLSEMSTAEIRQVIDVLREQFVELGKQYQWIQVFENKGLLMGCSNPHPHGQIWAFSELPNEAQKENRRQAEYFAQKGTQLLLDYAELETQTGDRLVVENRHWLAVVPFWAVWPYELLLMPKRHVIRFPDLEEEERTFLADILKRLLTRYDNLFETSFPYSMGWHSAPNFTDGTEVEHWQLHAHFYPPLLRSSTVKKFMVGFEMLSEPQRDLTAEQAARRLRELSEIHFKLKDYGQ